ncbi:hypothetical protein K461DRAFT_131736 [Myriangium duriaei CBS 260.36]|uniref:Ubiquitin-conjugating enzyme E2C-binding protein n=1 Tax=Myriangium duriaei CBS 260.36 TaxID=1168546 RepID=A0A9P4IZY1_9PEZI|nr:hypothetical protein K461DRAFT_131736 [Myriangium duriaei CBS 260.36]
MAQLLFAEYLGLVHTINLTVQLGQLTTEELAPSINLEGSIICLEINGEKHSVTLPASLVQESRISDCLPDSSAKTKTSRLKTLPLNSDNNSQDDQYTNPWSAQNLGINLSIHCCGSNGFDKNCSGLVLPEARISDIKDLPSETWAEMMDLWHCHKPDEPGENGTSLTTKGYSATSKLTARSGTVFVDTLSFLVSEQDCTNVRVTEETSDSRVICSHCESQIGEVDRVASGLRLFKPFLALAPSLPEPYAKPTLAQWLSCYLLGLIESTGVRKFHGRYASFNIWILSPSVVYSLSSQGGLPVAAMKVLFKQDDSPQVHPTQKLDAQSLHTDEVTLPQRLETALLAELVRGNQALPESAQMFQGWQVALLDRLPG